MRNVRVLLGAMLVLAMAATGCAKKADQVAETAGDSLLAASPVESPQGNMTPTEDFQAQPAETPPATTPTPAPAKPKPAAPKPAAPKPPANPGVNVPAGTAVKVNIGAEISSETAQAGDAWEGTVVDPIVIGTAAPIPAGSTIKGVIRAVKPAEKGDRAMLQLAVTSVVVNGKTHELAASSEEIVAGSTRARNLGAVAGGAAAGALIGKAVGGGKGALIGGLAGAAATAGAVSGTKGYQVVLKEGTEMTFTTDEAVVMK